MRVWIKRRIDDLAFTVRRAREGALAGDRDRLKIPTSVRDSQSLLRSILRDNIVPFWLHRAPDPGGHGYRLNHDVSGRWKGPAPKTLVAQSRTLWYFARLAAAGIEPERHVEAARIGFRFLRERMWDDVYGGFFWKLDETGDRALVSEKLLYGQAFAVYALSEYAAVSGNDAALELADRAVELVGGELRDDACGGFFDVARRDWDTRRRPGDGTDRDVPGPKRMNSHLHLMEALTVYCSTRESRSAREHLEELVVILSNTVVRKTVGACTDLYEHDWSPVGGSDANRVSYGHDVENVALLMEACRVLEMPDALMLDLYSTLFRNALRYGYDRRRGGFFASGRLGEPADRRDKIWWVQAEGLATALRLFLRTGEPACEDCYLQTLGWLARHQVDWTNGDWHATVAPNGRVSGDKASEWKTPYHNGRAVLTCLELLGRLGT